MKRYVSIGLFACLSGLFLFGCGAPPVEEPVDEYTPQAQTTENPNQVIRIPITTDGVTKSVVCVFLSSQSISCDWDGYHKSDSKPVS